MRGSNAPVNSHWSFAGRESFGISRKAGMEEAESGTYSTELLWGLGSFHCITRQEMANLYQP
jgi:hypothetical protein